jgi:hypothetical protein
MSNRDSHGKEPTPNNRNAGWLKRPSDPRLQREVTDGDRALDDGRFGGVEA